MPFPLWQQIPPSASLRDLHGTSVLISTDDPGSGVILRCTPALEKGDTAVLHARASRPNSLKASGVDDDTRIDVLAQTLLEEPHVHVVSIPDIVWKRSGEGRQGRTPIAVAVAALTAVTLYITPLAVSSWLATVLATLPGLLVWLLLREHIATSVVQPNGTSISIDAVVERAFHAVSDSASAGTATAGTKMSSRR